MECKYCGQEVAAERYVELGKDYCMSKPCLARHEREWVENYRLVLVPKQGFTILKATSESLKTGGKASGK
ncbi:hypothetical protein UFOVP621_79 [uncultured Caudovirales phage]|uniref:Uncharacterized protein n=1 Tax=uncultured Caudovirales phage TaxID=2100421 RepID=A0A6J5N7X8_9CAUD|nr:hypothetical protein UFOVP621_79 [uncultured Caudovirales phage]